LPVVEYMKSVAAQYGRAAMAVQDWKQRFLLCFGGVVFVPMSAW